ncbi:MAG TPA: beta-propeller fold lactonase family protein [Ignavibacteria bacterium]|nr:beta-propeller fold lactonase family protein [Ignavibacteria bacterium]
MSFIQKLSSYIIVVSIVSVFAFFPIYFSSCEQSFVNPETSTFPPEIESLFNTPYNASNNTCASVACHNSESRAGGLDLVNWSNAMNGSSQGTMIVPYNGFWSHLIFVVNSDTNFAPVVDLLPSIHKMPADKVSQLKTWIDNGAANKNGEVAFNSISNPCFITNQASDIMAVVDPSRKLVTRLFSVGGRTQTLDAPHYVTSDNAGQSIFVSLIQEGYIEKYNAYSYQQTGRQSVGLNPAHIVIDNANQFGYVSNFDASGTERRVKKFDANNLAVVDTVTDQRMNAPHGMAISSNGQFLYVASQIGEYLFKINLATFEIDNMVPVDPSVPPNGNGTGQFRPYQIAISPDNSKLFIACVGPSGNTSPDVVKVFDANSLSFIQNITVGDNPLLLKFSRNGDYVFVCNRNSNTVSVINPNSNTVIKTIDSVGVQPHGVDFTSDGQFAVIACETLSGFDGHHPTIGSFRPGVSRLIRMSDLSLMPNKLEMASFPAGIVILPYY